MILLLTSLFGFYGIISNDTTWSDTACLTGDVLVQSGVTLTIAPGTIVLYADTCEWDTAWYEIGEGIKGYQSYMDIFAFGDLIALGTEDDSIVFQSMPFSKIGSLFLNGGSDSLCYCSTRIGCKEYFDCAYIECYNAELNAISCDFNGRGGFYSRKSVIKLTKCMFKDINAAGNTSSRESACISNQGYLRIENCAFEDITNTMFGAIYVKQLDSCVIENTSVFSVYGFTWGERLSVSSGVGIYCSNCANVEIRKCILDGFWGGSGGSQAGGGISGGDGIAILLENYSFGVVDGCVLSNVGGGSGGSGSEFDGADGRGFLMDISKSQIVVTNNEFSDFRKDQDSYIRVEGSSALRPVIGGAQGCGNRFLEKAGNKGYVIRNNTSLDIDATWNIWSSPSLIDSLIYDYYDDPQKGIVHYDNYQGVEEGEEVLLEPFTLRSSIVHGVLTVSFASGLKNPVTLELFDINGCRVRAVTVQGPQFSLDVSDLARGAYFIAVPKSAGQKRVRKVIIY